MDSRIGCPSIFWGTLQRTDKGKKLKFDVDTRKFEEDEQ